MPCARPCAWPAPRPARCTACGPASTAASNSSPWPTFPSCAVRAHRRRPARCPGPRQPLAMAAGGHVPAVAGGPAAGLRLCRRAPAVAPPAQPQALGQGDRRRTLRHAAAAGAPGRDRLAVEGLRQHGRPGPPAHRRAGRQGPGAHPGAGGSQPRDGRRAEEDRRQPRLRQPDPARDPPRPPAQRHARRASLHPVETARRGRRRLLRVPRAGRRLPDRRGRLRRSRRARRADDHARPRAIDHAIEAVGSRDPAAILGETDQAMRSMLSQEQIPQALATNMDAGLVWVDRRAASWPSPGRRSRCTPATARRSRNSRARAGRSATSAVATTATSRYRWRRAGPST